MNGALAKLGYRLVRRDGKRWPHEIWAKVEEHGHWEQRFTFDTYNGGRWTFEASARAFVYKDEENWTTQDRIAFNPASRDHIGCNVGKWHNAPVIMSAEECSAVAEHIAELERMRIQGVGK